MSQATRVPTGTATLSGRRQGRTALRLIAIGWFSLLTLPLGAQQKKPIPAPPPSERPHFISKYPDFQLTAVADAIMVAPVSVHRNDPAFMGMVKAVRKGDAAVLNVEGTFAGSNAYPIANAGTTWVFTNPDRLQDLQWMGFNLFNAANNHSLDFGVRDLLDTIQAYKQYRAVFAGIGDNLGTARAPAYLETPRGRNVRRPAQNGSGAAAWRGRAKFEFLRAGQASF